jgi:hypothetical protein
MNIKEYLGICKDTVKKRPEHVSSTAPTGRFGRIPHSYDFDNDFKYDRDE